MMQCINPKCEANTKKTHLGKCPSCEEGTIRIMYSRAGRRFAGCTGWPGCTQTYPLRPRGVVTPTEKMCDLCKAPIILFGKNEECMNPDCPGKEKKKAAKSKSASEKKSASKKTEDTAKE